MSHITFYKITRIFRLQATEAYDMSCFQKAKPDPEFAV